MGIPGGANLLLAAGGVSTYEIDQSLRFDGSMTNKLYRTPSTSGNRRVWTISYWSKHAGDYSAQSSGWVLFTGTASNVNNQAGIFLQDFDNQNGTAGFYMKPGGSNQYRYSTGYLRDNSAWYHHVVSYNYGTFKYFLNGEEHPTTGSTFSNFDTGINSTLQHRIGYGANSSGNEWNFFHGYLAEYHLLDGTAVTDPYDFGEFDDNGTWRPIEYTGGGYGTNGFYLKFDSSATNGIGHDHSGNGNNFTASGFTTSGTGTDVRDDTPTNNYATWNLLFRSNTYPTYSEGSLSVSGATTTVEGTVGVSEGKWYFECTMTGGGSQIVGICGPTLSSYSGNLYDQSTAYVYQFQGYKGHAGSLSSYGASYGNNDVIGVAFDADAGSITFYKNNTSQGVAFTGISGTFLPAVSNNGNSATHNANFGESTFAYTPPSGYKAWATANLSTPSITNPSEYFNTILYTGNATNRSITGVGFQPDFVWIKSRSSNTDHRMIDVVRGSSKVLRTNTTDQEYTSTTLLTSFNSDGFSLGTDNSGNANGENFVAWCWKAGGSGSSNTSGSITSTVSASPTSGFSIVTYSGAGTNATVGHGLGVAPRMIWIKTRNGSNDWAVYHADLGASKILYLNLTYDQGGSGVVFGSSQTEPTSTVFTVGNHTYSGQSGSTYVAYCFAEVEGYSKIGSYVGNGSDDGVFIHLGFKPKWLLLKSAISTADDWVLMDVERSPYNVINDYFTTNHGNTEVTNSTETNTDFVANGIKLRDSNGKINASGSTYIYMAFAEHPFGGADISPATAR